MIFSLSHALGDKATDSTNRSFSLGFKQEIVAGRKLFNVVPTNRKVEVFNSGVIDQFAVSTIDGGNFAELTPTDGDELTLTQAKITASIETTNMLEHFDQYDLTTMMEGAAGIGTSTAKRIELDIQQLIKNGASANYTDRDGNVVTTTAADGNSVFNSAHSVNSSSTTYDNLDSVAFGQTGAETLENLFRKFLNHDAQRANRKANVIFSTTYTPLLNLIKEYKDSPGHPEDANHGVNTYMGKYQHIGLEYLDTDTDGADDSSTQNYWGLAVMKGKNLKVRIGREPTLYPPQLVQRSRNVLVQGEAFYSYGVEDPIEIAISQA